MEGILRQAADVEEVDRRLCEYEQGLCQYLYLTLNYSVLVSFCQSRVYNPNFVTVSISYQEEPSLHQARMHILLVTV